MSALILMYHDLGYSTAGSPPAHQPYVLSPDRFRQQVVAIDQAKANNLTVSDWCTAANSEPTIVITFDDGHVSNYELAAPILREYGLKATFFVTAGGIGTGDTLSWAQIREMHDAGMEIGSHTLTHRPPATLNDRELRHELAESRRVLEDGLGAPVTSISSPTGFFNPRMCAIAREVGYHALCFGRAGLASNTDDRLALPRIAVKRTTSDEQFKALLEFDARAIRRLRSRQKLLDWAKRFLGVEKYLHVRRLLLGRPSEP